MGFGFVMGCDSSARLFRNIKSLPPTLKYEPRTIVRRAISSSRTDDLADSVPL
jgi:hypothetical protein